MASGPEYARYVQGPTAQEERRAPGLRHVAFQVADVDAAYAELSNQGGVIEPMHLAPVRRGAVALVVCATLACTSPASAMKANQLSDAKQLVAP